MWRVARRTRAGSCPTPYARLGRSKPGRIRVPATATAAQTGCALCALALKRQLEVDHRASELGSGRRQGGGNTVGLGKGTTRLFREIPALARLVRNLLEPVYFGHIV